MTFTTAKADAFKAGDKVRLGNGEVGIVRQFITSPTGFHSYRVEITDGSREGDSVAATAPAMEKVASQTPRVPVSVGDRVFACRVAATPAEHQRGLQDTDTLGLDEGMLFVFEHPRAATFHMGSVRFPIDIMFVENDRVARVIRAASPGARERWSYPRADAVIEVAAGTAPAVGSRVAIAPPLGRDPTRYEISFPEDLPGRPGNPMERWKDRGTPDTADPNANQMSNEFWYEQLGYDTVDYHDDQDAPKFRPSAQAINDPAELIVGMIRAMSAQTRPLDWHRDALNADLAYAVVTRDDIADWVAEYGMTGGEATDVLEAATSSEGLQVLGDGLVLAGLAQIANTATSDEGPVLVLWTEYKNVA